MLEQMAARTKLVITALLYNSVQFTLANPFNPDFHWLSIELLSTDFEAECFASGCANPRLQIIVSRPNVDETKHFSWGIDAASAQLRKKPGTFLTYLPQLTNVTISSQLTGVDPKYNFPRVCDNSQLLYPFASETAQKNSRVQLQGDCFNISAYLSLVRIRDLYPKPRETVRIVPEATPNQTVSQAGGGLPSWITLALGGALLVLIVSFITLLIVHLYQKRGRYSHNSSLSSEPRRYSTSQNIFRTESLESKYDIPWDQKFRPLPDWLRSDMVTSTSEKGANGGEVATALRSAQYIADSGVEST